MLAPAVKLRGLDGQTIELAQLWPRAKCTVVVFLRHLG